MGKHKYFIAGALVAVIVAGVSGYFLGSGGFGSKGVSAPVFAESELDATVATWKFKGASHKISAREAIESQYSLDSVKDEDGNYPAPSADAVLSYVRNRILLEEASKQGIELSDEDLSSSAEASLGTSDFSAIADQYGVSEDQAKQIVREQGTIQKLYQSVMDDAPAMPEAPAEPESGDENEAKAEYAAYIIDLAGLSSTALTPPRSPARRSLPSLRPMPRPRRPMPSRTSSTCSSRRARTPSGRPMSTSSSARLMSSSLACMPKMLGRLR